MVGDEFISDDLAQIWIAEDGSIRSINPEKGIFGIIEDVNWTDDPEMLELFRNEKAEIHLFKPADRRREEASLGRAAARNLRKRDSTSRVNGGKARPTRTAKPVPLSHANARFTLSAEVLSNYSDKMEDPGGVVTRVFTYNGRDADTMPPVWVAKNMDHGIALGASIVSKATATEVGVTGVKRQPWANQPFIPGNLGDYMEAQFEFFNSDKIKEEFKTHHCRTQLFPHLQRSRRRQRVPSG